MTWKTIAQAAELDIPMEDLERIVGALTALERAFRPLTGGLTPDIEPALEFSADEDRA